MSESIVGRVEALEKAVGDLLSSSEPVNRDRILLYSRIGILELDLAEGSGSATASMLSKYPSLGKEELLQRLADLSSKLSLGFIKQRRGMLWRTINLFDEVLRIVSTWTFLIDCSVFLLPFARVAHWLVPSARLLAKAKNFVGYGCLNISGVDLICEQPEQEKKGETSPYSKLNMLAFTHTSTLDAFILAAGIGKDTLTMSKKELFIIPFFGWLMASFGGVAINREDRQQAIQSLRAAAESGRENSNGAFVCISPEGTRSKTGQLLPFKKGAFYTWEDLQEPLVPFIIFGAYDLYPPNAWMSVPGRVVCRFLKPILPEEVDTQLEPGLRRELMSNLLRRRMLEAQLNMPKGVGDESGKSLLQRWDNIFYLMACWAFNAYAGVSLKAFLDTRQIAYSRAALVGFLATMAISVGNYYYNLYVFKPKGNVPLAVSKLPQEEGKKKNN